MTSVKASVKVIMPLKVRAVLFLAPVLGFLLTQKTVDRLVEYCVNSVVYKVGIK